MKSVEMCAGCKGIVYPYVAGAVGYCTCMPSDYEQCNECGYDHFHDMWKASKEHSKLQGEDLKTTIIPTALDDNDLEDDFRRYLMEISDVK